MVDRTGLAALISLGIACGTTASAAKASGPIAHWRANGDGSDSVGGSNAAPLGPVAYEPTECGLGFLLGGGGHLAVPPPVAGALGGTDGFTVTATFREDVFGNNASIANLRLPANSSGFTLESAFGSPNSILFAVYAEGAGFQLLLVDGFTIGQTHRVAAVFDAAAGAMTLYRDGGIVGSQSTPVQIPMAIQGTESFMIGRNVVSGSTWTGMIDEVRFFDRALSAAEVAAISCCDVVADIDGSGAVDGADLGRLLGEWGPCEGCAADLNCDRAVDGADLGALLAVWG